LQLFTVATFLRLFVDFSALMNDTQKGPYLGTDFRRMRLQSKCPVPWKNHLRGGIVPAVIPKQNSLGLYNRGLLFRTIFRRYLLITYAISR
jgi:hypothetical protein